MKRVSSGIKPIDNHLGGFAQGRSHLVSGGPGTGKTLAALEFVSAGLAAGERCLLLTQDDPADLLAQAEFFGLALGAPLRDGRFLLLRYRDDFTQRFTQAGSASPVIQQLDQIIGPAAVHRIAVDTVVPILEASAPGGQAGRDLLRRFTHSGGCAMLTYPGDPAASGYWPLEHLTRDAAAILHLTLTTSRTPIGERKIEVRRVRGMAPPSLSIPFHITSSRGIAEPAVPRRPFRLAEAGLRCRPSRRTESALARHRPAPAVLPVIIRQLEHPSVP